jgi:hypothetical protein
MAGGSMSWGLRVRLARRQHTGSRPGWPFRAAPPRCLFRCSEVGHPDVHAGEPADLGALAGMAAGVAVGAAAGQFHGAVRRLGPVLGPGLVGGAAMAATDIGMYRLGVTDPKSWDASSWLSDALPHLAYGVATWALLPG